MYKAIKFGKNNIIVRIVADSIANGIRITTFELEYHRFIHSELMTHRCLAGDTELFFDLPNLVRGAARLHKMTIKEFHDKWVNGTKPRKSSRQKVYDVSKIESDEVYTAKKISELTGHQVENIRTSCKDRSIDVINYDKKKNEDYKILGKTYIEYNSTVRMNRQNIKPRLEKMKIRMLNEETNEIEHTTITDIWETGVQKTYKVTAGKFNITGTANHPILTTEGWKPIGELTNEDFIITCGKGVIEPTDPRRFNFIDGRWTKTFNNQARKILSVQQNGKCITCGIESELDVHHIVPVHIDPSLAFELSNVIGVCEYCHHNVHHKVQGWQVIQQLCGKPVQVESIEYVKEEMTYDLSVASEYHNFIANGIVVHNCFSRNAMSSRAIPVKRMIQQVDSAPAVPLYWGKNQPGMQAKEECNEFVYLPEVLRLDGTLEEVPVTREAAWQHAKTLMVDMATVFDNAHYHKQVVNRLLEPFQMMKTIVTATEFENFFWLRCDEEAQPEIKELAECMEASLQDSTPEELSAGEWHTPYVQHQRDPVSGELHYYVEQLGNEQLDWDQIIPVDIGGVLHEMHKLTPEEALAISSSSCAQVSYRNLDNSYDKAMDVYGRLCTGRKVHASPFEHQASPMKEVIAKDLSSLEVEGVTAIDKDMNLWSGNFRGYIQHRQLIQNHTKW